MTRRSSHSTPAELQHELVAAGVPCAQLTDIPPPRPQVRWAATCQSDGLELTLLIYPDNDSLRESLEHTCSGSTMNLGIYGKDWVVVGFGRRSESVTRSLGGKDC